MPTQEQLKRRVKQRQAEIDDYHRRAAPTEREVIIRQAIETVSSMDFWCDRCREDFRSVGHKVVQRMFVEPIAFYETKHRCGRWCRRHITDQHQDPYYQLSQHIKRMKQEFRKDMLQPGDPGFQTLYGDPYKVFYQQLEQEERTRWQRKPSVAV